MSAETSQLVGYRLVDVSGNIVQSWGGAWGEYPSPPDVLALPNGDRVHCPAVGTTYESWTLQPWLMAPPTPTPQSICDAALAAGLAITSTATPALNAIYGVNAAAQANITAIVTGIAASLGLPGGGSTFVYLDASSAPHTFTQAQFVSFASAVRGYVYALDLYAAGQGALPTPSATIP